MKTAASLIDQLERSSPKLALICGEGGRQLLGRMAKEVDDVVTPVGLHLTVETEDGWRSPEGSLRARRFLADLEILFWPEVNVDPLRLLKRLSRNDVVVAHWPGRREGSLLEYSKLGRPDHWLGDASGVMVVRPLPTTFPDEIPFEAKRIL